MRTTSTMPHPILTRDQVARHLSVSTRALIEYERRGLIRSVREGEVEGYEPAELRRVWTVLSLHREAGVNLNGIEVALRLRAQLDELRAVLRLLADELEARGAFVEDPDADG
jgi:MerR family transcriptional regulator/heat shock protein HspR